jgi:hypothetical protein
MCTVLFGDLIFAIGTMRSIQGQGLLSVGDGSIFQLFNFHTTVYEGTVRLDWLNFHSSETGNVTTFKRSLINYS